MKKDTVNIIVGDSITYGVGDTEYFGWVNRLKKIHSTDYYFNLGIPGQNSNDIVSRFDNEISARYNKEDNFRIIYAFGIKDALLLNDNKINKETFINNLEKIITTTKKYTNNIYFLGLLPVDTTIRKNYQESNILLIDNLIQDITQKENINYLKMKNVIELTDLSDGLHPNNIGHKMKIAVFTDIHGNYEALKVIIEDIQKEKINNIICLGDTIGIGPNPKECLDLIIENNISMTLGNHELYFLI